MWPGQDHCINRKERFIVCGILDLWHRLYVLLWSSLESTCKIVTIACFGVDFGFHFHQVPIFTNCIFALNFISLLPTHCVGFCCHEVLSQQGPIWSGTRVKTRKDAQPPSFKSADLAVSPKTRGRLTLSGIVFFRVTNLID